MKCHLATWPSKNLPTGIWRSVEYLEINEKEHKCITFEQNVRCNNKYNSSLSKKFNMKLF